MIFRRIGMMALFALALAGGVPGFAQGTISELPQPVAPGLGKGAIIDGKKAVTEGKEVSSGAEAALMKKAQGDVQRAKLNQNALNWQLERAKGGSATAMRSIGMRFLTGDGLPKDEKQAREWLKKGADGGDSAAKKELAKLDARGLTNSPSVTSPSLTQGEKEKTAASQSEAAKKNLEKNKVEK